MCAGISKCLQSYVALQLDLLRGHPVCGGSYIMYTLRQSSVIQKADISEKCVAAGSKTGIGASSIVPASMHTPLQQAA